MPEVLPQPSNVAIASQATGPHPRVPERQSAQTATEAPGTAARGARQEHDKTASLRINVELLDRLMTLTSELTLIRNQSLLAFDQDDDQVRPDRAARSTRSPRRFRRRFCGPGCSRSGTCSGSSPGWSAISDRQLGKQVEMTIVGRDVELDKTILEQLSDPLTHLVRNSVDHGIEAPADRLAKGKPAAGQITLTAAHEDGQIRIEIRDDGRGIDPQAVRDKALAMRLKTESELDRMSPRELCP